MNKPLLLLLAGSLLSVAPAWADALGRARPEDTIATRAFSGRLGRALRRGYAEAAETSGPPPAPYPVQRGLTGEILARFERKGLRVAAMKLISVSQEQASRHYAVHEGKPFYEGLVQYIRSSPVVAMVLEGPDVITQVRSIVGATRPNEAAPGTIRGDFGLDISNNLVHASDSNENAAFEIGVYFTDAEIVGYERDSDKWLVG